MSKTGSNKIPPPKGTRDLYPQDLLRQRYITEAWRRVSIRHGFEEIAGPTFEMLDLYKKKSGEGIVSELFSFTRAGGDDDYALRPEFTPTLARMYAEHAKQLPSPCKWFTAGPYFRAEKPQRGRLREFLQWNCDVMGGEEGETQALYDTEVVGVIITMLADFGFSSSSLKFRVSDRDAVARFLRESGVADDRISEAFALLDKRAKLPADAFKNEISKLGFDLECFDSLCSQQSEALSSDSLRATAIPADRDWIVMDYSIVRGLAYYTGTVFELIADGERAVAGGGRYDNLIELFGGPPTPAVGFGMGDVVLGLLLEDKGLMPEGPELMDALSQKPASIRPDAFVIANEEGEEHIEPLLAQLRRGKERDGFDGKPWDPARYETQPMHARRTYKSTKNIGKLLADARKQHAKFAVIIENTSDAKIENLDTREEVGVFPIDEVAGALATQIGG